jgi:pSer/pThr/pTyr-binding forkhead associated (FHA) protein
MDESPVAAHRSSPAELQERIEAERQGRPFLVYRDGDGAQRIHGLEDGNARISMGRRSTNDVAFDWDGEASRIHAQVELIAGDWTIVDDGLSQNGTFVNGSRITGRRRLVDGDAIRVGKTVLVYCSPRDRASEPTRGASGSIPTAESISDTQRKVLIALCRPYRDSTSIATPATNQEIAAELFLSVDAVKGHLRSLYERFGIEHLPQNRKRVQLVWQALQSGVIAPRDLWA